MLRTIDGDLAVAASKSLLQALPLAAAQTSVPTSLHKLECLGMIHRDTPASMKANNTFNFVMPRCNLKHRRTLCIYLYKIHWTTCTYMKTHCCKRGSHKSAEICVTWCPGLVSRHMQSACCQFSPFSPVGARGRIPPGG